ncbi:SWI-SNF chromatin-remodeling complex protein [Trichoderma guizhouense]|uniref:SWI-SNF chromatin-remodeling complex protein n=1 Tax=Trichoderma guizhouense TaxID=1491466 RepID=A0A1T3CC86_9HYPO|nr:SWI-SNF chromatin-remodeling complex protein [Trichoderma guizhouense]
MEDSYSHPVKRAQTSLTPQSQQGQQSTAYQVNVSRKKTRKWVEAKVQSYDGDDWGADEYDEESDHEPPPPPPINPSLRTFSGTDLLHSRHNTPSPASSLSALPSLRTQAQQQQQQSPAVPPANQPPRIGVTSPVVSDVSTRSASESFASGHVVSPQPVTAFQGREGDGNLSLAGIAQLPSQIQQQQQAPGGYDVSRSPSFDQAMKPTSTPPVVVDRSVSPQISAPAPALPPAEQPPPIIYSPDNYSRLQDDVDRETLAGAPAIPPSSGADQFTVSAPKPLSSEDRRDTWERDDDSSHSDHPESQGIRPDFESQAGIDRGRMSVSPKLPDLARMSAFGTDLFATSSSNNNLSKQTPISEDQADRGEPATIPAATTTESRWQPPVVPAEDEDHSEAPGGAPLSQPNNLFPGRNMPIIPPLRTPSPQPLAAAPFDPQGTKITPTEPLQPYRGEPLPEFEAQSFQRVQTYGTDNSSPMKDSPLKENDVLSDEIMRTLSPSGATPADVKLSDGPQLHPPEDRSGVRESSYTLMDYDSYWADTAEDSGPGHENVPVPSTENLQSIPAATEPLPAPSTQSGLKSPVDTTSPSPPATITFDSMFSPQQPQQQPQEEQQRQDQQQRQPSLRRRFSWEAEEEQRTPTTLAQTPIQAQPTTDDSAAPAVHLTGPSGQPFEPSVTNFSTTESRSHSPVSQLSQAPTTAAGSGLGALAIQTSNPSGSLPGHDSSLPEPPSPVSISVISDNPSTTAREQARMSIADEKLFADQGSVNLVTGSPPPASDSHPAVSSPTSAASVPAPQTPAPNLNPLAQAKAMNFRDIMALSTPTERIAKYTEAREALAARDSGLESWLLYLTTEHPELSASISAPGGQMTPRSSNNASLPVGSQPSSQQPYYQQYLNASSPSTSGPQSGGGGSGGGRSRLGGLSMPSQMSGSAFGHSGNQIGTKSKEFMHSAGKMGKGLLSKGKSKLRGSGDKVDTIPPDHPMPNKAQRRSTWRFSLEPRPREDDPAPHSSSDISTTPPQLPDPSPVSPLNAASGPGSAFPWSVSDDMPAPDPFSGRLPGEVHVTSEDLVIFNSFLHGAYPSAEPEEHIFPAGQRSSDLNPEMVTPDDWVMVQHQGEQSQAQRMSMSFRAMAGADDQARQQQSQPLDSSDTPKRNSSFIGLPPIRRGSTFGTKSKARRATERFSLDDEDGDDGADIDAPPLSPVSGIDAPIHPPETVTGMSQGGRNEKALPPQPGHGVPIAMAANPRFGQQQSSNVSHHPHHQQQQQQQPQQQYPGGPNPQFAQGAPMLDSLVQKLPPAGPWKLEESHLTEPLHLTKKRSGTDFSQQDAYYGYNKELGLEIPAAPVPPAQGPPGRFRSDVPPSSARRYPELFSLPGQDPRQFGRGQGYPPQMQGRPPREGAAPVRQQQGGPDADERGRRRNSGIFKELGTRIARATSRERRSSIAESKPPSIQPRGDEVSEVSVTTEDASDRRKKRASFFGFSGRPSSTDQPPRKEEDLGNQARQRDTRSAGAEPPADPREDHKRSLFGGGGQSKIGPGNFSRSSTSNSAFESVSGPSGDGRDNGVPHKRRISDIAKASGIAGLFGRARQDRSSLGAMPRQQDNDQALNQRAMIPDRPPMQLPSLDFTSDPLASMSSLGFEESFQNYQQDEHQPQPQRGLGQPVQTQFGNSSAFSVGPMNPQAQQTSPLPAAVGSQERTVASAGLTSQFNQPPQGISQDSQRQDLQSHLPPLATKTLVPVQNVNTTATEDQKPSGNESLETPTESQLDSAMDEKTPRLQEFIFQEKLAALQIGEDNVSEEEVLRSQTVSPDISIVSTTKTEEQGPVRSNSNTSEHSEMVEGVLITPPPEGSLPPAADADNADHSAIHHDVPPSVHSFPSISSLREKSDAKSIQQEGGSIHQAEESVAISPEPSPQVTKSQVSSKAATPVSQHQQLHSPGLATVKLPEPQSTDLPATPQSQTRPESQTRPLDTAGQRQLSTPSSPLPAGNQPVQQQLVQQPAQQPGQQQFVQQYPVQQQRLGQPQYPVQQQHPMQQQRPMQQQPVQQLRPQYAPSVSASNASIASEASTPVYQVQSGSQSLFAGLPGPFGRASTDAAAQQKDSQGSRWKGLKNRMSEQISQRSQPQPQQQQQQQQQPPQQQNMNQGQNKTAVGDKIKGNKLLGALRRTSKQPELNQNQANVQPSPNSRQLPNPIPQPHPQGYQPQPGQPQPGQLQGPRPNGMPANTQHLQPSMQPPNMPRAKTMPPGPPQQNAPPRDQTRSSEPRYESVPIPRGYSAVHGEGMMVPSPYQPNVRRQFGPLPPQQQQLQQHPHPHPHPQMQRQWQGGHPQPMSLQPQPTQFQGSPRMIQGPQTGGPGHMRAPSDSRSDYLKPQSPESFNTQSSRHNRHSSQGSQNSRAEPPRSASDMGSNLGMSHPGSPQPSEKGNLSVMDRPRSASRSPAVSVGADQKPDLDPSPKPDGTTDSSRASNLGIDVEKAQQLVEDDLYSATPKVVPAVAGDAGNPPAASQSASDEQGESSAMAAGKAVVVPANAGAMAELEDTEEARKRAIRLASQEEKIFYEPEDYEPKMSATSYPGQEWNPFGEPEFADWKED